MIFSIANIDFVVNDNNNPPNHREMHTSQNSEVRNGNARAGWRPQAVVGLEINPIVQSGLLI